MAGGARFWAAAIAICFATSTCAAAEVAAPAEPVPPPPPVFYVHAGATAEFLETNAQLVAGTAPFPVLPFPVANAVARPLYAIALEAGYYITPNVTIAVSTGLPPPLLRFKATGFGGAGILGTNLLGSVRAGGVRLLLQYHFTQFGPFQPYIGAGGSYFVNLGNINDGIVTNFSLEQNFAFVVQAGADWMITPNWGVFIDAKKAFFSTNAQGFVLNTTIPVRAHITLDPWIASTGITFKY